ncbi:hypothetical protein JOC34_000650 [Virgibacillus halotolerans]|uniref:host-nuclease inhibitor Gam family protein n=1 Tax=Virgibacillus halotolerans TaxID=1071053 RepID=UPI001960FABF|nr:host-nuclease inhibitor Gam family protein [Virgibacillus halotolerans]MBM7598293.1 hypothetical protein [Virgibacillus halotolerans]
MMEEEFDDINTDEEIDIKTLEDWKVDKYVNRVKKNNEEIKRYKEIMDKQVADLKHQFKHKEEALTKENGYLLSTLGQYARTHKSLQSTKTMFKLPMLNGDVVIKKSVPKPQAPKDDMVDKFEKEFPEYVEKVVTKKVKWADFKKKLIVQSDKTYIKETGESVSHLIDTDANPEEVIIK